MVWHGFSALFLASAVAVSEPPSPALDLSVQWFDVAHDLSSVRGSVKDRVSEIFETASVRIQWTDSGNDVVRGAVAVVLLPDAPVRAIVPPHAMGVMTDGENRRYVYVYTNPILRGAGLEGPVMSLNLNEGVIFSRALSRVVAHEIVHSLLPGGEHAESGIMSAKLTPRMLQRTRLELDVVTKCRIRRALGAEPACSETRERCSSSRD